MDLAWNSTRFDLDTLPDYLQSLAVRDFGPENSERIASAWLKYSHLIGKRKFEITEPDTYSVINFEESDRVVEEWRLLAEEAKAIETLLPANRRDALYHSLTYAAVAGHNYHAIVLGQGKNKQYALERRNSANALARDIIERFENDYDLTMEYDSIADGKWKCIMSTPKFDMDISTWRPPSRDVLAGLSFVQLNQDFDYAFGNLGIYVEQSRAAFEQGRVCASINPSQPTREGLSPVMRAMEPHGPEFRFIEFFHRGDHRRDIEWSIEVPEPWIEASETSGKVTGAEPEERIQISIDWDAVPANYNETLQIRVTYGPPSHWDDVHIPVANFRVPEDFIGFPEVDGIISIEAPHYQRSSDDKEVGIHFKDMPGLGSRSESGSVGLRPYITSHDFEEESRAAWLEYDIFIFGNTSRPEVNATLYVNGALDTHPDKPMEYALSVQTDGAEAEFVRLLGEPDEPGDYPLGWADSVADHVWTRTVELGSLGPGKHTLRWQVNSPEVYLEKIVLDTRGRLPESYLGPPETTVLGGE